MKMLKRIKFGIKDYLEDRNSRREYCRWWRLSERYKEMGCPQTYEEYEKVHRMFIKVMRKSKGWTSSFYCDEYGKHTVVETKEEVWKNILTRLRYSSDRMGWRNLTIITNHMMTLENIIVKEEKGWDC